MAGELGKASLDLEANLSSFERNVGSAERTSDGLRDSLEGIVAISQLAEDALKQVKMSPGQGAESKVSAEGILSGVRGISEEARTAARALDDVKLGQAQAAETDAIGDLIDRKLKEIDRQANETRRSLDRVKLAGGRNGAGVGPFGSGFGRIGLLGAAVGAGAVAGPALAPAAAGLLASIPTLAAAGVGAIGTLALAFKGLGKAIGGDYKAFKELQPAQQRFVLLVRSMDGWLDRLKQTAASNLFPGLTAGLKAAFSPGTVNAISKAVVEFARAIGQAGAQWGRYFGSKEFQSIFGPLMQSGARNLGVLSTAALRLFDALGVLGRAAIPLVNWLSDAAAKGAKLADSWLHAQDASGGLAHGMNEAKDSLRAVGGLFVALLRVIRDLGKALYPVSKVALKDLTDGLNALAGIIRRNQGVIREIVGTLLNGLVAAFKIAAGGVRLLNDFFHRFVGEKASVITAIVLIGAALTLTLGPEAAAVVGVIAAAGLIEKYWKGMLVRLVSGFGRVVGAIGRAFAAIPHWLDPQLHNLGVRLEKWGSTVGDQVGASIGYGMASGLRANLQQVAKALDLWDTGHRKAALKSLASQGFTTDLLTGKPIAPAAPKAPSGAIPSIDTGGAGAGGDVFGTQPPFTKNVPKAKKGPAAPLIPLGAQHAEALASANASRASALHNVGATAKRYLENELADLTTAAKLIRQKYEAAHGKVRAELFTALTRVLNKERTVRTQIAHAIKSNRAAALAFAVEQAKLAVENAKEGTTAWDKAVTAEEKALRAEIAYYDKLGHNRKLSLTVRKAALAAELRDVKELKALLKPSTASAAGANEAQFLASFQQIVGAYAPNAFPRSPASNPKTDTHLYDLVHEQRKTNAYLKQLVGKVKFPASGHSLDSALAAAG